MAYEFRAPSRRPSPIKLTPTLNHFNYDRHVPRNGWARWSPAKGERPNPTVNQHHESLPTDHRDMHSHHVPGEAIPRVQGARERAIEEDGGRGGPSISCDQRWCGRKGDNKEESSSSTSSRHIHPPAHRDNRVCPGNSIQHGQLPEAMGSIPCAFPTS